MARLAVCANLFRLQIRLIGVLGPVGCLRLRTASHKAKSKRHGGFGPIATLPQEFMSAMPPKADKPERTRMIHLRHALL